MKKIFLLSIVYLFYHCNNHKLSTAERLRLRPLPNDASPTVLARTAIPIDTSVHTYTLPNGFRYYIKKNNLPANKITLRLVVNIGSGMETADETGAAHFVEHLAFNTTKHFDNNHLIDFLESSGIRYGADFNAHTGFDKTEYYLHIPNHSTELSNKALLIMKDWANGILFEERAIEQERKIIVSEWRKTLSAEERFFRYWFPIFSEGSNYAKHLPLCDVPFIETISKDKLKKFYQTHYRPENMALVVVGNIDIVDFEKKIRQLFGSWETSHESPMKNKTVLEIPPQEKEKIVFFTDKEIGESYIDLDIRLQPLRLSTLQDARNTYIQELTTRLVRNHLFSLAKHSKSPIIKISTQLEEYLHTANSFHIRICVEKNKITTSLNILYNSLKVLGDKGFEENILEQEKKNIAQYFYKNSDETHSITNQTYADYITACFLGKRPVTDMTREYEWSKAILTFITPNDIRTCLNNWLDSPNRIWTISCPTTFECDNISEEKIKEALNTHGQAILPAERTPLLTDLLDELPQPKPISKQELIHKDISRFEMANGINVFTLNTSSKNDEIQLIAFHKGGYALHALTDFYNIASLPAIATESGISKWDKTALDKYMAGKDILLQPYMSEFYDGYEGSCSVQDTELLLKWLYLYMTKGACTQVGLDIFVKKEKEKANMMQAQPESYFANEIAKLNSSDNPYKYLYWSDKDLDRIQIQNINPIFKERFYAQSDFYFLLVGNISKIEDLKSLLEIYIGGLPTKTPTNSSEYSPKMPNTPIQRKFKKGLAPQSYINFSFVGNYPTDTDTLPAQTNYLVLEKVLLVLLRDQLRKNEGSVYSPDIRFSINGAAQRSYEINIRLICPPEEVGRLTTVTEQIIEDIKFRPIPDKILARCIELVKADFENNQKNNKYWLERLSNFVKYDIPFQYWDISSTENSLLSLSPYDVREAAKFFLADDKKIYTLMMPE